jgi:acetoin utilization protein AcuB
MNEIRRFMTESPHAIGHDQPLSLAHERMQHFGIRHLPVLDAGVLVGVISERDIALIGAVSSEDQEITVEEAMSAEPYSVAPGDDLLEVTTRMAEHKYGCAVVMSQNKVVGVFTTTDALHVLAGLLRQAASTPAVQSCVEPLAKHAKSKK